MADHMQADQHGRGLSPRLGLNGTSMMSVLDRTIEKTKYLCLSLP